MLKCLRPQLLLYDGAKNMLQKAGINLKTMNLDQMRADFHAMEKKKAALQKSYRSAELIERISHFTPCSSNIALYLFNDTSGCSFSNAYILSSNFVTAYAYTTNRNCIGCSSVPSFLWSIIHSPALESLNSGKRFVNFSYIAIPLL